MAKKKSSRPKQTPPPQKKITIDAMRYFAAEAKASQASLTADGFDNFVSRIGLNNNNTLSASTYEFNLITRNRIKLEATYRGSWIAGKLIDCVPEDMTRAGIDIQTSKGEMDLPKIRAAISRLKLAQSLCFTGKLGRLYGGALGMIQIKGQDTSTEIDVDTISKGQFVGIVPFDRWQLNPLVQDPIEDGPDMGLPSEYQIVNNPTETEPSYNAGSIVGMNVHHSRCLRYTGIDLPYFQAITEMMWGESILERLWDRLIAFDNATMSAASLVDRASLRTVKIDGLREVVGAGGPALKALYAQFDMMRELQTNEGLTLLDKNDEFDFATYTFAGLPEVLIQFGQQLAGAGDTPLVRLFGQSPAGLNASGDADIRMYYDYVNSQQEAKLRNFWEVILKILWRSELGKEAPDDLEFKFVPLWQMSATDKVNNAKTTAETVLGAYEAGVIKRSTTLLELRDSSGETGVFSNITDEEIEEADEEQDAPPLPGDVPPDERDVSPALDPAAKDPKVEPSITPVKSLGA